METIRATRIGERLHEARVGYESRSNAGLVSFSFQENSNLVDGIGGVTWDGALVLCGLLERLLGSISRESRANFHLVELGCGSGVCGMVAAQLGCKATVTDRCSDLAAANIAELDPSGPTRCNIEAHDLSWEMARPSTIREKTISATELSSQRGLAHIIVGAEIACLRKQQAILADTITQLCAENANAVVLLSFDDIPPPNGCKYETEMLRHMQSRGFRHHVVAVADCVWTNTMCQDSKTSEEGQSRKVSRGRLHDRTAEFCDVQNQLLLPFFGGRKAISRRSTAHGVGGASASSVEESPLPMPPLKSSASKHEQTTHHITLFFRPSAVGVCRRCQAEYFHEPVLRRASPCTYHPAYFVCRYHPAEVRCSINGQGDGLGYYGNGREGYAAKFWDCCGSEDPDAPGCCQGEHLAY